MRAICYKCGYEWVYRGNQRGKSNLSCPKCSYRLRADKVLLEDDPGIQAKLHSPPLELHKTPLKIHTYIHDKEKLHNFIEVEKGIWVDQKIAKQFQEAPEETEEVQQEESAIRILPPKFEIIRIIPRDPIKIIEHQKKYGLMIANI